MTDSSRDDFYQALGESFSEHISPPVPFDEASPHECCEAIWSVLGFELTPRMLAGLREAQLLEIRESIASYFDSEPPSIAQVKSAIAATLARWPADE